MWQGGNSENCYFVCTCVRAVCDNGSFFFSVSVLFLLLFPFWLISEGTFQPYHYHCYCESHRFPQVRHVHHATFRLHWQSWNFAETMHTDTHKHLWLQCAFSKSNQSKFQECRIAVFISSSSMCVGYIKRTPNISKYNYGSIRHRQKVISMHDIEE